MRVLLVVHGFPPMAEAGSEIYADTLARALRTHAGDEVTVFTREADPSSPEYALREYVREGVRVVAVNNTFREVRSFEESYDHPRIAGLFAGVLADVRPHVAHVHHLTCLSTRIPALLADADVPVVVTLHDYWMLCHRGQLFDRSGHVCEGPDRGCTNCIGAVAPAPPLLAPAAAVLRRHAPATAHALVRLAGSLADTAPAGVAERDRLAHMMGVLRRASRVLAPSDSLRHRFIEAGLDASRIQTWPLGFDREASAPSVERRGHAAPLRIGFVGTLMWSKGPHLLLESVDLLPAGTATVDLYGEIVPYHGDDTYRSVLRRWDDAPHVRFHGHVSHDTVAGAYQQMSVLVMTSLWPENSPLVIREAFLAGIPVVAPRLGGIPELVRDGVNGLLYEPGDVEGLRAALLRLATEDRLLERLSRHREPVRSIADDAMATHALYAQLVTERHAPTDRPADRIHAVVLNYHTPDQTLVAVRSLLTSRHRLSGITVIDNSDNVECGRVLSDLSDHVEYSSMPRNLGFAGGVNVGARRALASGATHVLLVNSDVTVPPDAVGHALQALAQNSAAGIAGARVVNRRSPDRVDSDGITFDRRTGRMRLRNHDAPASTPLPSSTVDAVSGCFLLADRSTLEACGGFTEGYFFGFEDIDFCERARTHGRRTILSRATVYHDGAASLPSISTDRLYYATRNHLALASRLGGTGRRLRLVSVALLNVASALRASPRRWPGRLFATVEGFVHFVRGLDGPRSSVGTRD